MNQVVRLDSGWDFVDPGFHALEKAGVKLDAPSAIEPSDSVLPRELFSGTRGYIEKVVRQINGSFDCGFYDCCAVRHQSKLWSNASCVGGRRED